MSPHQKAEFPSSVFDWEGKIFPHLQLSRGMVPKQIGIWSYPCFPLSRIKPHSQLKRNNPIAWFYHHHVSLWVWIYCVISCLVFAPNISFRLMSGYTLVSSDRNIFCHMVRWTWLFCMLYTCTVVVVFPTLLDSTGSGSVMLLSSEESSPKSHQKVPVILSLTRMFRCLYEHTYTDEGLQRRMSHRELFLCWNLMRHYTQNIL